MMGLTLCVLVEIKDRKENVIKKKAMISAFEPAVSSHTLYK
jgi:hypothetical protein